MDTDSDTDSSDWIEELYSEERDSRRDAAARARQELIDNCRNLLVPDWLRELSKLPAGSVAAPPTILANDEITGPPTQAALPYAARAYTVLHNEVDITDLEGSLSVLPYLGVLNAAPNELAEEREKLQRWQRLYDSSTHVPASSSGLAESSSSPDMNRLPESQTSLQRAQGKGPPLQSDLGRLHDTEDVRSAFRTAERALAAIDCPGEIFWHVTQTRAPRADNLEDFAKDLTRETGLVFAELLAVLERVERTCGSPLLRLLRLYKATRVRMDGTALRTLDSKDVRLNGYALRNEQCPVCFTLQCSLHDLPMVRGPQKTFDYESTKRPVRSLRKKESSSRSMDRGPTPEAAQPCGSTCHLLAVQSSFTDLHSKAEAIRHHVDLIGIIKLLYAHPQADSCFIAAILEQPCNVVQTILEDCRLPPSPFTKASSPVDLVPSLHGETLRPEAADAYVPCDCKGGCYVKQPNVKQGTADVIEPDMSDQQRQPSDVPLSKCGCIRRRTYCDSLCGCDPLCPRRFKPCVCSHANRLCSVGDPLADCPCEEAGRECDPDMCSCTPHSCQNRNLQQVHRTTRKTNVADSLVCNGYGLLYADKEDALSGDFILEYTGTVIPEGVADARGHLLYADRGVSYVLEASRDYMLDGEHGSSLARYINQPGPRMKVSLRNQDTREANTFLRVVQVRGVARVGVYASRQIKAGDELLVEYGEAYKP